MNNKTTKFVNRMHGEIKDVKIKSTVLKYTLNTNLRLPELSDILESEYTSWEHQ